MVSPARLHLVGNEAPRLDAMSRARSLVVICGRAGDPLVERSRERLAGDSRLVVEVASGESGVEQVRALQDVLLQASAEFITIVRAGELVLPGSVPRLCDALQDDPAIAMVHGRWFALDEHGSTTREAMREQNRRRDDAGYIQALPTFRRSALLAQGGFRGSGIESALVRAAAGCAGRGAPFLDPAHTCGRLAGATTRPAPTLRRTARAFTMLIRDVLGAELRVRPGKLRLRLARVLPAGRVRRFLLVAPRPYHLVQAAMQALPPLLPARARSAPPGPERIAYVLWRYPILSETFIRREVDMLRRTGMDLVLIALEPDDVPCPLDSSAPVGDVRYYGGEDLRRGREFLRRLLLRRPVAVLLAASFVIRYRYRPDKSWARDLEVLAQVGLLARELSEADATHVHAPWATHTAAVAMLAARLLGLPFSVQARASDIHRRSDRLVVPDRVCHADLVITNSEYNVRALRQLSNDRALPPLHVIYDSIDASAFPPVAPRNDGAPVHILCVARLVESKGLPVLLRALRQLRDEGLAFTCEIVGGGDLGASPASLVEVLWLHASLGLQDVVALPGPLPFAGAMEAFARADVFVLPCVEARDGTRDITPNSILEAMAAGLPVISTTVGAIPETLEHGRSGLLVPPGDVTSLAAAIRQLVQQPALRAELGENARQRVGSHFHNRDDGRRRASLFRSLHGGRQA